MYIYNYDRQTTPKKSPIYNIYIDLNRLSSLIGNFFYIVSKKLIILAKVNALFCTIADL